MGIDFQTVISGVLVLLVGAVVKFARDISEKMTIVVTKVEYHERAIEDLEERVRHVEIKGLANGKCPMP